MQTESNAQNMIKIACPAHRAALSKTCLDLRQMAQSRLARTGPICSVGHKVKETRTPSKIGPKLLAKQPVWEFLNDDEHPAGDTAMRPVANLPVDRFDGRLFGTIVTLADGSRYPAAISDLAFGPKKYQHHFRSLTIFAKGKRFHLAKYFQIWHDSEGPDALATFLGKKKDAVFPIFYDLTNIAVGPADIVKGVFQAEISNPIPKNQLMKILVGGS